MRRRVDSGAPAVLGLIRSSDISDPTQNHQVMATTYSLDAATKDMVINLYDPNYPERV